MKMNWKAFGISVAVTLCIIGCTTWFAVTPGGDPNDPNDIVLTTEGQKIEAVRSTAEEVAKGVSVFWPPATLIAGALASAGVAMKKYKPKIAKAETQRDRFYSVAETLVYAVDKLKKDYPEDWEKHLEPILKKNIDPNGSIDAVIRALRGLPPKS